VTSLPPKVDVLGTGISATTVDETAELILDPPADGLRVAICAVHGVMAARRDPALRAALASVDIATTDGVPLVWALRLSGVPDQQRVYGNTVFRETIERGLKHDTSHFFYGSTPETLHDVVANLTSDHPSLRIAGFHSPPFRTLTDDEIVDDIDAIAQATPDVVWVGLGMPKQELWMAQAGNQLPGISIVGVGAVFDWVAGNVKQAPEWMQGAGLEWLYRIYREPRRLWRRYLWNNPAYLALLAQQVARQRVQRSLES
jgi:N-acetylglucosaminyldiphosphoundecaprenol N-acetyl-beta-D-mannosaminyltransferase